MTKKRRPETGGAWYAEPGAEQDVIVSTKASLARNLANFPFPSRLNDSESERIQSIVFDAFHFLKDADEFQAVPLSSLDSVGTKVMTERGVLFPSEGRKSGLILRSDGKVACTVNTDDHLRISSFASGLGVEDTSNSVYAVDSGLQKHIQFAASYDFGYLSYSVLNCGSGLSIAAQVHLPALSLLKSIRSAASDTVGEDFLFEVCYGAGGADMVSGFGGIGSSLGSYYVVSTKSSAGGTELSQLMSFQCVLQNLVKEERNARKQCRTQKITEIANYAYRALALAKTSLFIPFREAIEIISGVKFGIDMGLLSGVAVSELHALLYRIQEGHLEYVLDNGTFSFEKDIRDNRQKKIERLRALILQEAFEAAER